MISHLIWAAAGFPVWYLFLQARGYPIRSTLCFVMLSHFGILMLKAGLTPLDLLDIILRHVYYVSKEEDRTDPGSPLAVLVLLLRFSYPHMFVGKIGRFWPVAVYLCFALPITFVIALLFETYFFLVVEAGLDDMYVNSTTFAIQLGLALLQSVLIAIFWRYPFGFPGSVKPSIAPEPASATSEIDVEIGPATSASENSPQPRARPSIAGPLSRLQSEPYRRRRGSSVTIPTVPTRALELNTIYPKSALKRSCRASAPPRLRDHSRSQNQWVRRRLGQSPCSPGPLPEIPARILKGLRSPGLISRSSSIRPASPPTNDGHSTGTVDESSSTSQAGDATVSFSLTPETTDSASDVEAGDHGPLESGHALARLELQLAKCNRQLRRMGKAPVSRSGEVRIEGRELCVELQQMLADLEELELCETEDRQVKIMEELETNTLRQLEQLGQFMQEVDATQHNEIDDELTKKGQKRRKEAKEGKVCFDLGLISTDSVPSRTGKEVKNDEQKMDRIRLRSLESNPVYGDESRMFQSAFQLQNKIRRIQRQCLAWEASCSQPAADIMDKKVALIQALLYFSSEFVDVLSSTITDQDLYRLPDDLSNTCGPQLRDISRCLKGLKHYENCVIETLPYVRSIRLKLLDLDERRDGWLRWVENQRVKFTKDREARVVVIVDRAD